jgi:putative zinc finger protein
VSGACERYLKDLPLYAEGELNPQEMRTIRIHLVACPGCREFIAAYDDFTGKILEEESPERPFPAVDLDAEEEGSEDSWMIRRLDVPRTSQRSRDAAFSSRVMSEVRRAAARQKTHRARRIAAAILLVSGLALGGLAWLGGRPLGPEVAARFPAGAVPEVSPLPAHLVSDRQDSKAAAAPARDLASSWWVIDPEHEKEAREAGSGREMEAVLYSGGLEGEGTAEARDFMVLKGLLKAARRSADSSRSGSADADLIMVPESDGAREALSLRPVALPVRVPEGDIAPGTRLHIRSPAVRYRIVWIGGGGAPLFFGPVMRPDPARSRGGFPLPPPPVTLPAPSGERY